MTRPPPAYYDIESTSGESHKQPPAYQENEPRVHNLDAGELVKALRLEQARRKRLERILELERQSDFGINPTQFNRVIVLRAPRVEDETRTVGVLAFGDGPRVDASDLIRTRMTSRAKILWCFIFLFCLLMFTLSIVFMLRL